MMKKLVSLSLLLAVSVSAFADIRVTPSEVVGPVKLMNCVNNGPTRNAKGQIRDNFDEYKALCIPYARTHDAAFCNGYGGPHTVDINQVFPDFSRDPDDPTAYDFVNTDVYLQNIMDAGTKVFFRLGQTIEHTVAKYGVIPPADYKKWARICEHVIRHCNEGWADGHYWGIEYWEIWNEADGDESTWQTNPVCWGGSKEDFFDFYEVAAKYLDKCFPDLKIGGPALAYNMKWAEDFLASMSARKVPMDFFSWHMYSYTLERAEDRAVNVRKLLEKYGYGDVESILNEWNIIKGWTDDYVYNTGLISEARGAAYVASMMSDAQNLPVDMLMYYDFRIGTVWNGAFDMASNRPKRPYYAFYAWKKLLQCGIQVKAEADEKNFYVTAAKDDSGKVRVLVSRYSPDENDTATKIVKLVVEGARDGEILAHVTDPYRIYTEIPLEVKDGVTELKVYPNSFYLIEY